MKSRTPRRIRWTNPMTATKLALTLGALMLGGLSANAATLTVTSLADTGAGSLRAQVAAAAAGDTIDFAVTGIIEAKSPAIAINKNLTITGPGASSLTISGNGNDGGSYNAASLFRITAGIVGISGLTLSNGTGTSVSRQAYNPGTNSYYTTFERFGGGIYMTGGTVTITDTTISSSIAQYGGGIFVNGGSLELTRSTVSNNRLGTHGQAGGLYLRSGTMAISQSTISGNTAGYGAGLISSGTMTISDSTISGNTAENYTVFQGYQVPSPTGDGRVPGIIYYDYFSYNGVAGGILNNGTMTLSNSTVSGNEAKGYDSTTIIGGGGINNRGTLTVANSTITGNKGYWGGGVYAFSGTLNLSNSIVAGNISTGYINSNGIANGGGPDISGPVNAGDYNLVQTTYNTTLSGTHNITGQDAKLGTLADNGGPTKTHLLLTGSPAFDAGDPNFDTTNTPFDQRGSGYARVRNSRLDIGALESKPLQSGSSFIVNTLADHDDGVCDTTDCTLREAISGAPANSAITFSVTGTITLTGGEMAIAKNLTIQGPSSTQGITISGNGASRIFLISGSAVNLSNLSLSGGNGVGGTYINGYGGAIHISGGTVTFSNSTFSGNSASYGGAIAIKGGGVLNIANSTFSGNNATYTGGAIHVGSSGGTVTVANSTLSGNSTLSVNSAPYGGGGIYLNATQTGVSSTLNIFNSIVAGNSATSSPDIFGTVASGNYNIIGGNPNLGSLADNGGPTKTMALLAGSPAIDAGDPNFDSTNTPFDQRGSARKSGGAIDIGAFELLTPLTITGFTPDSGLIGTSVTITGTGFLGTTAVTFDGGSGTAIYSGFVNAAGTAITVTVPTGATTGTISVTTPNGTVTSSAVFSTLR